eukprot:gene8755-14781_t
MAKNLSSLLLCIAVEIFAINCCLATTCDQTYTANYGVVTLKTSPPNSITQCRFVIKAPSGYHVQLEITNIGSGYSNCYYNSLRLFEGGNPDFVNDIPTATYCSINSDRPTYLSQASTLTVLLTRRSGYSFMYPTIHFRLVPGYNMVFNLSEGFIPSPNFINRLLPRSQSFTYRLEGAPGMKVQLFFSYMNLGSSQTCTGARLSIYESPTATGVPAQTRCGRNTTSYLSSTNIISLKFDNWASLSGPESGFKIFYAIGTEGCKRKYSGSSGEISFPLYPFNYPNNTKCKYDISVRDGQMIFIYRPYYYSSYGDSLNIFERIGTTGETIVTNLLNDAEMTYWSIGKDITMVFQSDNNNVITGMAMHYTATNEKRPAEIGSHERPACERSTQTAGCNLVLGTTQTFVSSPLFPHNYPNGLTCTYLFGQDQSPREYGIEMVLQEMRLEDSPSCKNDSLKVYDGANATTLLLDNLCGSPGHKQYVSSTGKLYMIFKTNGKSRFKGFRARLRYSYRYLDYLYSDWQTGTLQSWNYPYNYPHRRSEIRRISTSYGNRIILRFTHFDLEKSTGCSKDSLKIYEGSVSKESLKSTRCGKDGDPYVSNSNSVILLFTTDVRISKTGYEFNFEACGGVYSNYENRIRFPWYYSRYPNGSNCRYEVTAKHGFGIRIIFNKFSLENSLDCKNDKFSVYETAVASENLIATRCGNNMTDVFSSAAKVIFVFRSNEDIDDTGFDVTVQACSSLFRNDTGTLFSPQYPYNYPTNSKCTYFIRLAKGAKIQLVFRNFSLFTYQSDRLTIYDVHASSSFSYYGSNAKDYLASGNEVVLTFSSWWRRTTVNSFKGFRIYYYDRQGFCSKYKPCRNNASCTNIGDSNYTCSCSDDFTGRNCSVKIVPCKSNPCMNNGTCTDLYGHGKPTFNCSCTDDFQGNRCRNQIGFCTKHKPCQNKASCTSTGNGIYTCSCPVDFTGKNCSIKIVPCKSNPCLNNGICTDIYGRGPPMFQCKCLYEYYGTRCEHEKDPCSHYLSDDTWKRSTSFKHNPSRTPLCDKGLTPGWYRFTSKAGDKMPNEPPSIGACGTPNSIWANGTLPKTDGSYSSLVACVRNIDSTCSESWPLPVKRCRGTAAHFFVYKLKDPNKCPLSYCAGFQVPCPRGRSSLTGFPPCDDPVPVFWNVQVKPSYNGGNIIFSCKFTTKGKDEGARYEVRWFQGNSTIPFRTAMLTQTENSDTVQNDHKAGKWHFRIGRTVELPNAKRHKIREAGEPLKITVSRTIDVVCSGSKQCSVRLYISHDNPEILLSTCSVLLDNKRSSQTIEVHAKRDFIDDGDKSVTLKMAIDQDTNATDWLSHQEFDNINIDVIDVPTARCWSNGDPRILTFDKQYFGHFQPGDHVFVKSSARKFEVHVRTWQCGSVTCNCGVAVTEGDDTILLDMCWDGIPRIRFLSHQEPAEGTTVRRDPTGKSFVMKFPSGSYVRFDSFYSYANVIVQIPSDDYQSTTGLCGTFDGNYFNELLSKDGNYHYHEYGWTAPLAFSESWKMQLGRSLFYYRGGSSKCMNSKTAYCDCSLPAGSTSKPVCKKYTSIYQQTEFEQSYRGWKELRHPNAQKCAKRKRRSSSNVVTLPDDNDALDYVYDPKPLRNVTVSWPTKSGKTAKSVTDYCETAIKDSPPGKICAKINEFNFTTFIMQCVEDIKITDDNEFARAAVRAMQDACEEILLKNTLYWETDPSSNGSMVPSLEMGNTLCPGMCSGNGRCINATCVCDGNFTSADCSIDKNKGPVVTSIPGNGLCDARNRSDCHLIRISGKDFIDSEQLTCLSIKVEVKDGSKNDQNGKRKFNSAYLLSFREVLCDLGNHPVSTVGDPRSSKGIPFASYRLQVSNDGNRFSSNRLQYTVYDSKCMQCNATTKECSLKPNTCNVNGHCYLNGEKYSKDPCFVCKPSLNKFEFSTECTASSKNLTLLIVLASVGSAVFAALMVCIIIKIKKRPTKKITPRDPDESTSTTFNNKAFEANCEVDKAHN